MSYIISNIIWLNWLNICNKFNDLNIDNNNKLCVYKSIKIIKKHKWKSNRYYKRKIKIEKLIRKGEINNNSFNMSNQLITINSSAQENEENNLSNFDFSLSN